MSRPLRDSFRDAFRGLRFVLRSQRNVRIHLVAAGAAVVAGLVVGLAPGEWATLVLVIVLVLALEMANTALETLADAVVTTHHPWVGTAKDVAAGAVLVSALGAVAVGLILFVPKLLGIG